MTSKQTFTFKNFLRTCGDSTRGLYTTYFLELTTRQYDKLSKNGFLLKYGHSLLLNETKDRV